ncbi:MAG: polyprenyl diphosphate synthase [Candidatus Izemoplasmataceae bacterium]
MALKDRIMKRPMPKHVAIILDGNGRWAKKRGRDRTYGHQRGALNIKTIALEASRLGIEVLSVYAFSTENWKRPESETGFLMKLPKRLEEEYKDDFKDESIRVVFSGRRDRVGEDNRKFMEESEEKTKDRDGLIVNICFDYGGKSELTEATKAIAKKVKDGELSLEDITENTIDEHLFQPELPPVDLLIRTSGAQRLSNYMLWQVSYAEFYFTKTHWPAFNEKRLHKAIDDYQRRDRKFGGLKLKKG